MEKTQNSTTTNQDDGLLDLLVTLAENAKLLIIGSLLVGLCALGVSFVLPQTFQSVAVLQADQAAASLMVTTAVLDPVIATLALGGGKDDTVEEARRKLREQVKTAVARNDKLLTLTVSDRTALQAQAIANAVLQQTYQASRPKGMVRARIEAQLAEAQARLKNAQSASAVLLKRLESNSAGVNASADVARGYAELLSATGAAQGQIGTLETQLEGLSEAMLIQSPTLPLEASLPKKGLVAIGATLAAGLALLLFVFMRQALRHNMANASGAGKWARIRQSLGLK